MAVNTNTLIVLYSCMCNDLDLKGNHLLVYAIIHGYTNNKKYRAYNNSYAYMCNWLSISRQQASNIVNDLIRLGYIIKPYAKNIGRVRLETLKISKEKADFIREERINMDPNLFEITDGKWVEIKPYMVNELKLSNHELIFYAAIENLTANGISPTLSSLTYLRSWSSVGPRTYKSILKNLVEKGYLIYEYQPGKEDAIRSFRYEKRRINI